MTWALILILLGLTLLIMEVFLPSGGLLLILALTSLVSGVTMIFFTPESDGGGTQTGLVAILGLFVAIPLLIGIAFYFWPYTPFGKRMLLKGPTEDANLSQTPQALELEQFRGHVGKTLTPHQPSGTTLISGKRLDSITEGMFIDANQMVKVINIRDRYLVIRPALPTDLEIPSDLQL